MNLTTYKEWLADLFDQRADTYDTSLFHRQLAARLLEYATLGPAERVLDIATGTGLVALTAAQFVGEAGWVLGTDISQGMLQGARGRASALGLTNISFMQADAEAMELDEASFDTIWCCSALIYLNDIPRALRNWHTALRPGGKLALTCFADTAFYLSALFGTFAAGYGLSLPSPHAPCGSALRCQRLVEEGGVQ